MNKRTSNKNPYDLNEVGGVRCPKCGKRKIKIQTQGDLQFIPYRCTCDDTHNRGTFG